MAIRTILTQEDETLRKKAKAVDKINPRILKLLGDMYQTMKQANGVGLAAPQVGVLRRVVVIDVGEGLVELINPEIVGQEGAVEDSEGCLSVPGVRGYVVRPQTVTVKALDRSGEPVTVTGEGLMARALCHEIDHLDGVLFVDKMTALVEDEDGEE